MEDRLRAEFQKLNAVNPPESFEVPTRAKYGNELLRDRPRGVYLGLAIGLLSIFIIAATSISMFSRSNHSTPVTSASGQHVHNGNGMSQGMSFFSNPDFPSYPAAWRVEPQSLPGSVDFQVVVPNTAAANRDNMTDAFVWPDGSSVAMDFPSPHQPAATITQSYIEVWEAPWRGGDPVSEFEADIKADPVTGKSLIDIQGTPALVVEAHSPDKDVVDHANPAFLRMVSDGIEIEVSGGESLDLLVGIARSILVVQGPSSSPTAFG